MENPFTLTFGRKPYEYIARINQTDEILDSFTSEHSPSQVYMLTGVRGSGKTVLMASIANYLFEKKDWIVVELNSNRNLLKGLAARLYEEKSLRSSFLKAKLDLSFLGIGVSIEGSSPVSDVEVAIERMLDIIKKSGKRLLITIDEVTNSQDIREFVSSFQIFLRHDYPIFLLMTGLYENVDSLQNAESVTFLLRAPKINMEPLDRGAVVRSYQEIFNITLEEAKNLATLAMGYPFGYQVLGYLCFENDCATVPGKILNTYDQRLSEYVYSKIWSEMSEIDRKVAGAMTFSTSVSEIMKRAGMTKSSFSPYRSRLIKRGLVYSPAYGELAFILPRFKEFVKIQM